MSARGSAVAPIEVYVVSEPRRLYRLCPPPATEGFADTFRSNFHLDRRPRGAEIDAAIIHMGLSMFDQFEQAAKLARALPQVGESIATVELTPGLGTCIAKTGRPGHWTVWGRPEQLLECVVGVVEVQK